MSNHRTMDVYRVPGTFTLAGLDATVAVFAEEEDQHPRDHFTEPDDVADVVERFDGGNPWAWFCARVVVTVEIGDESLSEDEILGCCSYESGREFAPGRFVGDEYVGGAPNGDYFDAMYREAAERLEDRIDAVRRTLVGWSQ